MKSDTHQSSKLKCVHSSSPIPARTFPTGQALFHALVFVVCATAITMTFYFEEVPPPLRRGMAPETFPRILIILITALTSISLYRIIKDPGEAKSPLPGTFWFSLTGLTAFLVVGFFIDIILAMVLFTASVSWAWGNRKPAVVITLAVAVPAILFLIFSEVLGIRFPHGIITNLIYG